MICEKRVFDSKELISYLLERLLDITVFFLVERLARGHCNRLEVIRQAGFHCLWILHNHLVEA